MAREKFYRYKMTDPDGKLPKCFIRMEDNNDVAVFSKMLSASLIEKYKLIDLNDFKKLTKIRSSKGMLQQDLADLSGISIRTIQGWELNGMNGAAFSKAMKIADVLKVNPHDLLEDE